jgi:putative acetyltransferase
MNEYTESNQDIMVRKIELKDNQLIAIIIRSCLEEFGANKPGTVYYDKTTDHLFELFSTEKSVYFIAELNGQVVGGGGIFPSDGLTEDTCELVKMYLKPEVRKMGLGAKIISNCIEFAGENGYKRIYLESMPELKRAISVYEKFGFSYLSNPMGNTGHHGCSVWMCLEL